MQPAEARSWVASIENELRAALAHEASGHDSHHAFRVRDLGVHLANLSGGDRDVVEATALLHDVGHAKSRADHAAHGARVAEAILSRSGFPNRKIPQVVGCIEHHHWQPGNAGDPADPSIEYQVFADADRLDALGAIGITARRTAILRSFLQTFFREWELRDLEDIG